MDCNYSIKEGELLLNNCKKNRLLVQSAFFLRIVKFLLLIFSFCLTVYITYLIFKQCIVDATLSNCIPLGSIFATFGSAVISVISLYCNRQISSFQENLSALHEQITNLSSWKRWPFLKRYSREISGFLKYDYYILKNPQITFKSDDLSLTIPLPTCTADFYDLPIFANMVKMFCFRKHFANAIVKHRDTQEQKDIFTFYCVLMIYRNIIRYKIGILFMLIGSEFVLSSIVFSFCYTSVSKFLL